MIKSVTVTNPLGASKKMVLLDPESSGIFITNIDGLGAEEASIYTTDLASIDGSIFNNARLPQRDINLTLMPLDTNDGSVEDHRLEIYKYFPIKQKVKLVIETDNRLAEVTGYVQTNQPDIFSDKSSVSVTITCPDPYFYDVKKYQGITTKIFTSVYKSFQFRYKNDITDIISRVIELYNAKGAYIGGNDETQYTWKLYNSNNTINTGLKSSLRNNDIILFIPQSMNFSNPDHQAYIQLAYMDNGSLSYDDIPMYNTDGSSWIVSEYDNGRFMDGNDEDDILILKYSDNRFYVQGSFNKEDHLDMWKKTKFGEYASQIEQLLKYEGDVQIGATFYIDVFGDLRDFSIVNVDERAFFSFDDEKIKTLTGSYLKSGDQIEISTVKGNKYVILKRDGETTSLLGCIDKDSTWFELNVGDNIYTYLANDTSVVSLTVKYKTALIGI